MLKKELAGQFPSDADRYIRGKTDFLLGILRDAGVPDDVLKAIADANRTQE